METLTPQSDEFPFASCQNFLYPCNISLCEMTVLLITVPSGHTLSQRAPCSRCSTKRFSLLFCILSSKYFFLHIIRVWCSSDIQSASKVLFRSLALSKAMCLYDEQRTVTACWPSLGSKCFRCGWTVSLSHAFCRTDTASTNSLQWTMTSQVRRWWRRIIGLRLDRAKTSRAPVCHII